MEKQDKLHVYKQLHRISLLVGVLTILLPIIFWSKIPDEIPMHYNAAGVVDNWSDKNSLILLFFVVLMLMGVMSIAVYVVKSNMESKYSKEAEKSTMRLAYPIVVMMNLVVQVMFAYITFCTVTSRPLGSMFLPIFLTATFVPLGYLVYKCAKIQGTSGSQKPVNKRMSLRRIQIDYEENDVHRMVLISPVNRKTFIEEIEQKRSKS